MKHIRLCRLTLWAKWAIAQGPALKGAPHLLKGLLKINKRGKEKQQQKEKNDRRDGRKVKKK